MLLVDIPNPFSTLPYYLNFDFILGVKKYVPHGFFCSYGGVSRSLLGGALGEAVVFLMKDEGLSYTSFTLLLFPLSVWKIDMMPGERAAVLQP